MPSEKRRAPKRHHATTNFEPITEAKNFLYGEKKLELQLTARKVYEEWAPCGERFAASSLADFEPEAEQLTPPQERIKALYIN